MKIKPRDGIQLRDPVSHNIIAAEGVEVSEHDLFWARRVRDGDAVLVEESPSVENAGDNKHE